MMAFNVETKTGPAENNETGLGCYNALVYFTIKLSKEK